jgi:uncharacterized membrane protein
MPNNHEEPRSASRATALALPWLAFGYPVLAHVGVWLQNFFVQWLALVWLVVVMLAGLLFQGRVWAWASLLISSAALYFLAMSGDGMYALYLPPIAIPVLIFWLFARTLRAGAVPLVTRIAATVRGEPLPEVLRVYTRRVTRLWCAVALALLTSAIVSALWASPERWSLITNVIHYVVIGAVFVIEFAYRRMRYAKLEPWGFAQ